MATLTVVEVDLELTVLEMQEILKRTDCVVVVKDAKAPVKEVVMVCLSKGFAESIPSLAMPTATVAMGIKPMLLTSAKPCV